MKKIILLFILLFSIIIAYCKGIDSVYSNSLYSEYKYTNVNLEYTTPKFHNFGKINNDTIPKLETSNSFKEPVKVNNAKEGFLEIVIIAISTITSLVLGSLFLFLILKK